MRRYAPLTNTLLSITTDPTEMSHQSLSDHEQKLHSMFNLTLKKKKKSTGREHLPSTVVTGREQKDQTSPPTGQTLHISTVIWTAALLSVRSDTIFQSPSAVVTVKAAEIGPYVYELTKSRSPTHTQFHSTPP